MESLNTKIDEFLKIPNGDGNGSGCGSGSGWGNCNGFGCNGFGFYGHGDGCGSGFNDDDGSGSGSVDGDGLGGCYGHGDGSVDGLGLCDGSGSGSSSGWGDGSGDGSSSGWGDGSGDGSGSGFDDGSGDGYGCGDDYDDYYDDDDSDGVLRYIKSFCGKRVYMIDDVPTLIDRVSRDVAKGRILRKDMTTTPCFVVKGGGYFAHGVTLRDAMDALRDKQFEDTTEDERIEAFIAVHEHGKKYPCADLYDWHHKLTGSCEMGRREFAKAHGIDIEHGSMTVDEFIDLTRNAYGGTVIKALEKAWNQEG